MATATSTRTLDVLITESSTVYRGVPFTVVGDWIQQGRLVAEDRVRPAGANEWMGLAQMALLAPYLPRPEPFRAEDKAEALEEVELDVPFKRSGADEETEVDMIPLIDVSLVLLIFFMMTASGIMAVSPFDTPAAEHAEVIDNAGGLTVGITNEDNKVQFFLGESSTESLTLNDLVSQVDKLNKTGQVKEVIVKAAPTTPFSAIKDLTVGLQTKGVKVIRGGVKERGSKE